MYDVIQLQNNLLESQDKLKTQKEQNTKLQNELLDLKSKNKKLNEQLKFRGKKLDIVGSFTDDWENHRRPSVLQLSTNWDK